MTRIEEIKARLETAPHDIALLISLVERLQTEFLAIRDFAYLLVDEDGQDDENYRDAGREAAGRQLHNILNSMGVPK